MRIILFLILFFVSAFSFAQGRDSCANKYQELVKVADPYGIISSQQKLVDEYGFVQCDDLPYTLVIALHEAVHLSDWRISCYHTTPGSVRDLKPEKTNLQFLDGTTLAPPAIPLPKPGDVLKIILDKAPSSTLSQTLRNTDYFQQYMLDPNVYSSLSFTAGLSSEFNGYNHGAMAAQRLSNHLGTNQPVLPIQRKGAIFFAITMELYLAEIEKSYPASYSEVSKNQKIKNMINRLMGDLLEVLVSTNFCGTRNDDEQKFLLDMGELTKFSAVDKLLQNDIAQDLSQSLRCTDSDQNQILGVERVEN